MSDLPSDRLHPAAPLIHCIFYLRVPAGDGASNYEAINVFTPSGVPGYPTTSPPAVGDIVGGLEGGGTFRVVARQWELPQYGSMTWPQGRSVPTRSSLTVIVEPADGVFSDEVSL